MRATVGSATTIQCDGGDCQMQTSKADVQGWIHADFKSGDPQWLLKNGQDYCPGCARRLDGKTPGGIPFSLVSSITTEKPSAPGVSTAEILKHCESLLQRRPEPSAAEALELVYRLALRVQQMEKKAAA